MQEWRKLGLVAAPDPSLWWQRSHLALPTVLALSGARHRVFFAARDDDSHPHVGRLDIDLGSLEVLERDDEPVLSPGPPGHFDDAGIYASSAVRLGSRVRLYTLGRNNGPPPLYYMAIGIAESDDGGRTFPHRRAAPIMTRSELDPWMVTVPFVTHAAGRWRMWYSGGSGWSGGHSHYLVRHATSDDGLAWHPEPHVCLGDRGERNVVRPCVLTDDGRLRAWFSVDRGDGYRMGYAESSDGRAWTRRDDAVRGLAPSGEGWDGNAIAYGYVVRHGGRLFCFYNGDDFGREGIGLAVCEP